MTYRVDVEHVDGEVVGGEVHRAEELLERHHFPFARLAHLQSTDDHDDHFEVGLYLMLYFTINIPMILFIDTYPKGMALEEITQF